MNDFIEAFVFAVALSAAVVATNLPNQWEVVGPQSQMDERMKLWNTPGGIQADTSCVQYRVYVTFGGLAVRTKAEPCDD